MEKLGYEPGRRSVDQLARRISRWNLAVPAIVFLEVAKPFSFIAGQCLHVCQPLLSTFFDGPRVTKYAELLADRSNLEYLAVQLQRDVPIRGDNGKGIG
jgi:hypothetical protein